MSKEKVVSFDSIRGTLVEDIPSNFYKMSCFGNSRPEWSVYHEHNIRTGNSWRTNREYISPTVPYFRYYMDAMGQRWLSYTIGRGEPSRSHKYVPCHLNVLIPSNRRTQKDIENNRIAPHSLFFRGGILLAQLDPLIGVIQTLKVVDGSNLPRKLLPEPNKTVEQIGQDEIQRLADLIDLQTNGRLTYDFIRGYCPPNGLMDEKIHIHNPKDSNKPITLEDDRYSICIGEYNVRKNSIYTGYDKNGRRLPDYQF